MGSVNLNFTELNKDIEVTRKGVTTYDFYIRSLGINIGLSSISFYVKPMVYIEKESKEGEHNIEESTLPYKITIRNEQTKEQFIKDDLELGYSDSFVGVKIDTDSLPWSSSPLTTFVISITFDATGKVAGKDKDDVLFVFKKGEITAEHQDQSTDQFTITSKEMFYGSITTRFNAHWLYKNEHNDNFIFPLHCPEDIPIFELFNFDDSPKNVWKIRKDYNEGFPYISSRWSEHWYNFKINIFLNGVWRSVNVYYKTKEAFSPVDLKTKKILDKNI